jgi:hypothetical protein
MIAHEGDGGLGRSCFPGSPPPWCDLCNERDENGPAVPFPPVLRGRGQGSEGGVEDEAVFDANNPQP